jgi:hypothetical protein
MLKTRFREHFFKIKNNSRFNNFIYQHFKLTGHDFNNISVQPVEQLTFEQGTSDNYKTKARCIAELEWIKNLQTAHPLGLNDNIYNKGNISKDISINAFSYCNKRIRNKRSHGTRKNGNIRRKNKRVLTLTDCHNVFKNSGKHRLLSTLCSLSLNSLIRIDNECNNMFNPSDPLYECTLIIKSFTDFYLKPLIDSPLHKKRNRLKINFCNKGIDLIDLPKIFNDKNVQKLIPPYFRNTETPLICYKYTKPIRKNVFNYNDIVTDDNILHNSPESCDCAQSAFKYNAFDHVITGDLNIIENKQLRKLLRRGPKFRLPTPINFETCMEEIENSIMDYCGKWCKRENADISSLYEWKNKVLSMIEKRVNFFIKNPLALPPKSKFNKHNLFKSLKDLQRTFVFVPADKAANNIIII